MLEIATFDIGRGGSVLYKALSHPLAAQAIAALYARLAAAGDVAIYDPANAVETLAALHPLHDLPIEGIYVQDVRDVGLPRLGRLARPVTALRGASARAVLVAAFDAARATALARPWFPPDALVASLDEAALPEAMRSNRARVLDPLNYATNLALFRDADGMSTRLVTANYWAGYGARNVRLWLRLFDCDGGVLAEWEEKLPDGPCGIAIDSGDVRARFGLPEFEGNLFLHAIGAAGHDVVKYVLDLTASDGGPTLSATHDANPWPADRYAGFPAPAEGERVLIWLQNPHPVPIPAGAVALGRMGQDLRVPIREAVPAFGARVIDAGALLPEIRWPAQLELFGRRYVVRPRYEVVDGARRRIAHANVERTDLLPDAAIPGLSNFIERGFLLPFPVLDPGSFRTFVLPTPMATAQADMPLAIEVFSADGRRVGRRFLGRLARDHAVATEVGDMLAEAGVTGTGGHAELVYDFHEGGGADGWLHGLFRYEHRGSGHVAESSFGSHLYNTIMTWKGEPQSYAGPPPGLSTRLFLPLGRAGRRSFAVLIHPSSSPQSAMAAASRTALLLHDEAGRQVAEATVGIPVCGSVEIRPEHHFTAEELRDAGERGYVLVRDLTCRLFGYQGLLDEDASGGFSLDHMFGF